MLISGALSGLAGAMLIVGPYGKIEPSIITLGYGYAGIVVAALARNNLGLIIVSGSLFSGLRVGGNNLQVTTDTPIHIGVMLQGAILLFALGGEAFRRYHIHGGAVCMNTGVMGGLRRVGDDVDAVAKLGALDNPIQRTSNNQRNKKCWIEP